MNFKAISFLIALSAYFFHSVAQAENKTEEKRPYKNKCDTLMDPEKGNLKDTDPVVIRCFEQYWRSDFYKDRKAADQKKIDDEKARIAANVEREKKKADKASAKARAEAEKKAEESRKAADKKAEQEDNAEERTFSEKELIDEIGIGTYPVFAFALTYKNGKVTDTDRITQGDDLCKRLKFTKSKAAVISEELPVTEANKNGYHVIEKKKLFGPSEFSDEFFDVQKKGVTVKKYLSITCVKVVEPIEGSDEYLKNIVEVLTTLNKEVNAPKETGASDTTKLPAAQNQGTKSKPPVTKTATVKPKSPYSFTPENDDDTAGAGK